MSQIIKRPQSIFDVINQNIVTVGDDLHTLMGQFAALSERLSAFESVFQAPEEPNACGAEGVQSVSSGQENSEAS